MKYFLYLKTTFLILVAGHSFAQDATSRLETARKIKFASMALRGKAPDVSDSKAIFAGQMTFSQLVQMYLDSPDHVTKMRQFFGDQFGMSSNMMLVERNSQLRRDDQGIYFLANIASKREEYGDDQFRCPLGFPTVDVEAWWLPAGQTIKLCGNASSTALTFIDPRDGRPRSCARGGNIDEPACGCGPHQLFCLPEEHVNTLYDAVSNEFVEHAMYAYQNQKNWHDVFAWDKFRGNRFLYYYYFYSGRILSTGESLSEEEYATLRSIPLDGFVEASFPDDMERSGVATAPFFLKEFNNNRGRIRNLTQNLVCQDITSALNVDNYTSFVNPDMSQNDRRHGEKADCAGCHYPLDNMASMLHGWNMDATFNASRSQLGHSFGVTKTGPKALLLSYLERSADFLPCMAQTAYEHFSGAKWDDLPEGARNRFTYMSKDGPKSLIRSIVRHPLFLQLKETQR